MNENEYRKFCVHRCTFVILPNTMEPQTWWNQNAERQYTQFQEWVGDEHEESKVYSANHCIEQTYKTILDLGCGDGTFFTTIKSRDPSIEYMGVDSCDFFVQLCTARHIPVLRSDIRSLPEIPDGSIDFVFSRHTWEHQPEFQSILREMVRLANHEACHIFFIKPHMEPTKIVYEPESNLYHNVYSKTDIETILSSIQKVKGWTWVDINAKEVALHITV